MQVCKEAHAPVAFATPVCPACLIIKHFTEKIEMLNQRIEVLESDVQETTNVA
jgi:hypothetical protein